MERKKKADVRELQGCRQDLFAEWPGMGEKASLEEAGGFSVSALVPGRGTTFRTKFRAK